MKTLLIWPAFENYTSLDGTWIPHGVAHLYTETKAKGFDIEVIDGRFTSFKETLLKLSDEKITHVGISIISAYKDNAYKLLKWISSERPDITTIIGGIHATLFPQEYEGLTDYYVVGEGEIVFPEILQGLHKKGIVKGYIQNLDLLLPIDRTIWPEENPINVVLPKPFITLIIGRGCPYQCTFCQPAEKNIFGSKLKLRSIDHVLKELFSTKAISFYIHDDCFIAKPQYVNEFCDALKKYDYNWWCQGRSDLICNNIDLIKKMRDTGLKGMIIGHESGSDEILKRLKKGTTVAQNIESTKLLHALGLQVSSNIMIGLPNEKPSQVLNTINMVIQMQPDLVSVCPFTPHPGSYLYQECLDKALMPKETNQSYYNRGKFEPKIEGQDYDFLFWAAQQINNYVYNRK